MSLRLLSRFTQAALLAASFLLAGCETTGPRASTPSQRLPEPSTLAGLRPGDTLSVALQGVPDPSTQSVQIDEQGTIGLPFIGRVEAAGSTVAGLTERIRQTYLDKKIYHHVDVSVSATERYVFVGGEVNRPGRVLWTPDLTVTKAIQAAGGFTIYARETRLSVIRDEVSYPFDAQLAQRKPDEDARLAPGDAIQVPKSAF